MTERAAAAPGRPRSPAAERAILQSALRLLGEHGYAAMSMEGVAAAAGAGKATIYRRYRDKKELVMAAMATLIADTGPPPDTGNTRADLVALLAQVQQLLMTGPVLPMAGTVLVEEQRNPDLLERFREAAIRPGRARLRTVLEHGVQRGHVRTDIDLESVVDVLLGVFFARHLAGRDAPPGPLDAVVDLVWHGIAVADEHGTEGRSLRSGRQSRMLAPERDAQRE